MRASHRLQRRCTIYHLHHLTAKTKDRQMTEIAPPCTTPPDSDAAPIAETAGTAETAALRPAWYKRPITWIAIAAVLSGATVALVLTVVSPDRLTGPDAILARDGYAQVVGYSQSQMDTLLGAIAGQDAAIAQALFTVAAGGVKDNVAEVVIGLTPAGRELFSQYMSQLNSGGNLPQGTTAHLSGSYLVINGPAG